MKTPPVKAKRCAKQLAKASALFFAPLSLGLCFWLITGSAGLADNTCTVCHKRTLTIMVPCNSLDYRRHKDHGDPDGACAASRTNRKSDTERGKGAH